MKISISTKRFKTYNPKREAEGFLLLLTITGSVFADTQKQQNKSGANGRK